MDYETAALPTELRRRFVCTTTLPRYENTVFRLNHSNAKTDSNAILPIALGTLEFFDLLTPGRLREG